MFKDASPFDQPIAVWNTSSVINMQVMFKNASTFNQPIGDWTTSKATSMQGMFVGASAFNRPIFGWNTFQVTTMYRMFKDATSFNQCLSTWTRTSNNVNTTEMLENTACPNTMDSPNPTTGQWCQVTACSLPP